MTKLLAILLVVLSFLSNMALGFPVGTKVCPSSDGLRIRNGTCTDKEILAMVNTGDVLTIKSSQTVNSCGYEWCQVQFGQIIGWAACNFLVQCSGAGTRGLDISAPDCQNANINSWKCWVNHGYSFAIVQVWQGGVYHPNMKAAQCVADAWTAGMKSVDVYTWMCPNCQDNNPPESVIDRIDTYLKQNKVRYGRLWFDVELCDNDPDCWNDPASNAQWLLRAVRHAAAINMTIGIYSQKWEWANTVGNSLDFNKWPLWYANFDNVPNFSDGTWNFGGWTKPYMKQYYDHGPADCGVDVDLNWLP